jgi:hypothetical protein
VGNDPLLVLASLAPLITVFSAPSAIAAAVTPANGDDLILPDDGRRLALYASRSIPN